MTSILSFYLTSPSSPLNHVALHDEQTRLVFMTFTIPSGGMLTEFKLQLSDAVTFTWNFSITWL
jgi:hypothetical protein